MYDEEAPKLNDGHHRVVPVLVEASDLDLDYSVYDLVPPPKRICTCKPKGDCEVENVDMRFGFSTCAHNEFRCCEKMEEQEHCECSFESDCVAKRGTRVQYDQPCPGQGFVQCCTLMEEEQLMKRGRETVGSAADLTLTHTGMVGLL